MPATSELIALVTLLPTPYLLLSVAFVIEAASEAYLTATLSPRERLVGQYLFDASPDNPQTPEARSVHNLRASLEQVLATGQPHEMAQQHYDVPDPTRPSRFVERHWQPRNTPMLDAQGRVLYIIHSVLDVTAEEQAQAHLRQSQAAEHAARAEAVAQRQHLHDILMQLPAQVATNRGPDHVYDLVNPCYQQQFPARVLQGLPVREALPELAGQHFFELLDQVYQTGEPFYGHEMPAAADYTNSGQPELRYFNVFFQALRDAQGRIDGVLNFAYDVTVQVEARCQVEQLNAELEARVQARTAALQESEGRFRTMADAAPAILWVTDPDGQCTYLNAQWYQYTGQTEAEALGLGWTQAVHPDDAALAGQKFLAANTQRTQFYVRYRLRRHDGVYRWAIDTGRPHFTPAGAYAGLVGTVFDIHEQQLAEDELHATNEQLRRTNVDLDTFVYTASHDLKAPITNIESITLALRDTLPAEVQQDEMIAHLLDLLAQTTTRFQLTIGQLTDLSKLQLAHAGPAEPVNLAAVIESVRLDLVSTIVTAAAQLTVAVAPDLLVSFSPANLRSAIYNLLSNAVKYRALDRPAEVQVRAYSGGARVVLEVQDNGLGLNEHQQSRLFGLFQRLHTHVEGTGMGLYITKRLVENGGGTIAVASQVDVGTTFTLTFPA